MRVTVIAAPEPFVSLEEAKDHLGELSADRDALIEAQIAAACSHIDGPDGWLGRSIGFQTLEARHTFFDKDSFRLPFLPVITVTEVRYLDSEGVEQTLSTDLYEVRGDSVVLAYDETWPAVRDDTESVRVIYDAGYEEIPPPIKAAVLLMVGDMFRFRETAKEGGAAAVPMSTTVENLLSPFRVFT